MHLHSQESNPLKYTKDNISAVILDLGGVVLNLDIQRSFDRFRALDLVMDNPDLYKGGPDGLFHAFEKGEISSADFINRLKKFNPQVASGEIIDAWNAMLLDLPAHRVKFIQDLSKSIPVIILSNTNELHVDAFEKYLFDQYQCDILRTSCLRVWYSHLMGLRKPDVEIYQKVMAEHGFKPSSTLFVDDNKENVAGAVKAGLVGHWLLEGETIEEVLGDLI